MLHLLQSVPRVNPCSVTPSRQRNQRSSMPGLLDDPRGSNTCHYQCISFHSQCAGLSVEELRWLHLQLHHAGDTESYTPTITSAPNLEQPEVNAPVPADNPPVLVKRPSSFRALHAKYNAPHSSPRNSAARDEVLPDTSIQLVSPGRSTQPPAAPAPTDSQPQVGAALSCAADEGGGALMEPSL